SAPASRTRTTSASSSCARNDVDRGRCAVERDIPSQRLYPLLIPARQPSPPAAGPNYRRERRQGGRTAGGAVARLAPDRVPRFGHPLAAPPGRGDARLDGRPPGRGRGDRVGRVGAPRTYALALHERLETGERVVPLPRDPVEVDVGIGEAPGLELPDPFTSD